MRTRRLDDSIGNIQEINTGGDDSIAHEETELEQLRCFVRRLDCTSGLDDSIENMQEINTTHITCLPSLLLAHNKTKRAIIKCG